MIPIDTPYYLIDENRMIKRLERIVYVRENSGAKSVLALKCFSSYCAFPLMSEYMDGTTSSGVYEARLGYEKFGGETHGYSVAYSEREVSEMSAYCDKIIFNSLNQLRTYKGLIKSASTGLRVNPEIGWSCDILSDPSKRYSRLGVLKSALPPDIGREVQGLMFHYNCENKDFPTFASHLKKISENFGIFLSQVEWVSLGGGVVFTADEYPLDDFCRALKDFGREFDVQVYLEPGEAAVSNSASLVVTVLDIVENERTTLIVDAGSEPHMTDVLMYRYAPELEGAVILADPGAEEFEKPEDGYVYTVCGRTCLSGDEFGVYKFDREIKAGDRLEFSNAGGYSMVKKNWFNGLQMPAIVHKKLDGSVNVGRVPSYEDFKISLS